MKLEKSYNTKQYFHSFYRQNHALLVLSFLFTVICFPANLIGSWLLGQVIDAITEVSMNRLRTIILVSIIFIVTIQISLGDHGRIPSGLPCGHIRPSIAVRHHRRPENTPQRHRTACGVWRGYCQRPQGSEPLPCGDPSL